MLDSLPSSTPADDAGQSSLATAGSSAPATPSSGRRFAAGLGALVAVLGTWAGIAGNFASIVTHLSPIVTYISKSLHPPQSPPVTQPSSVPSSVPPAPLPVPTQPVGDSVTGADYERCVDDKWCTFSAVAREACYQGHPAPRLTSPATCISWDEAVTYCKWTSHRLPTTKELMQAAVTPGGFEEPLREWVKDGVLVNRKDFHTKEEYEQGQFDTGFHCAVE